MNYNRNRNNTARKKTDYNENVFAIKATLCQQQRQEQE